VSNERPRGLTITCWVVIVWSALGGTLAVLRLARVMNAASIYHLVLSVAKIACAIAMLRGVSESRRIFLLLYLGAALILGPAFYWSELGSLMPTFVIGFLLFFAYLAILTRPEVLRYFGEEEGPRISFERFRVPLIRLGARAFVAIAMLLVAGFIARAVLDVYALVTYKRADAVIVDANVRDADVTTRMQRDPTQSTSDARSTTTIVTYDPKITFRYVVDGRTYERTGFTTFGSTLSATFSPASIREKYAVGTQTTCWYDPHDPSRAVLEFGVSPYYAFAFFALIMLTIARTVAAHVIRE